MGSVGRALTQMRTIWGGASPWQRAASAVMGIAAAAAIIALATIYLRTSSEDAPGPHASRPPAPAEAASDTPASSQTDSAGAGRSSPLSFRPFSSLQSAAARDAEKRITEAMSAFRDVVRPRVLIRPAIESPFGEDSQPASALVIVGVREGGSLTGDAIEALAECATASGASLDDVSVLSEDGAPLFRNGAVLVSGFSGFASPTQATPPASPQSSAEPTRQIWPVVGATAGVALLIGLLGGHLLTRPWRGEPEHAQEVEPRRAPTETVAAQSTSGSSPLAELTPDELITVVADERPAIAARLLERADDEAAAAALQSLSARRRGEVLAVSRSAVRPWRRSHAVLHRAALEKLAAGGGADGARD